MLEGLAKLDYFNVDRLRPEQVKTIEVGYRGTHAEKFYIDCSAYSSWYTDFIGYIIGISGQFRPATDPIAPGYPDGGLQAYRLAANATGVVRTQGANIGVSYFRKWITYGVNYSYNQLVTGDDDPIIPAFNTPQNKFNVSFTAHDMKVPFTDKRNLGFGINWKFIEGFTFTGSPQFTGPIPSYDMVDAQVNVKFPAQHLMVKLGASNLFGLMPLFEETGGRVLYDLGALFASTDDGRSVGDKMLDNEVRMVFGGPYVGRLGYLQLVYEFAKR